MSFFWVLIIPGLSQSPQGIYCQEQAPTLKKSSKQQKEMILKQRLLSEHVEMRLKERVNYAIGEIPAKL